MMLNIYKDSISFLPMGLRRIVELCNLGRLYDYLQDELNAGKLSATQCSSACVEHVVDASYAGAKIANDLTSCSALSPTTRGLYELLLNEELSKGAEDITLILREICNLK